MSHVELNDVLEINNKEYVFIILIYHSCIQFIEMMSKGLCDIFKRLLLEYFLFIHFTFLLG